jgi:hypothetical protein
MTTEGTPLADALSALRGRNEEPISTVEVNVAISDRDPAEWRWCYRITVPKDEFDELVERVRSLEAS